MKLIGKLVTSTRNWMERYKALTSTLILSDLLEKTKKYSKIEYLTCKTSLAEKSQIIEKKKFKF